MANVWTCSSCTSWLQAVILVVNLAVWNDALELDFNITRNEITTFLGQPANLGCYATNTSSSLAYFWTKDNQNVTQSSKVKVFGDLLVVTPEQDKDYGVYNCNITNGVSSALCRIRLLKGLNKTESYEGKSPNQPTTGCVNISVLMPVLAVAVMSLLLFIHLVIRGKRAQENQLKTKRMKQSDDGSSRHSEASTAVIEEPIEMHANEYTSRPMGNGQVSRSLGDANVSRSPVSGRTTRNPVYGHASRSPVSGRGSRSPISERASRSPVNIRSSRSPGNVHEIRSSVNENRSWVPNQEDQDHKF